MELHLRGAERPLSSLINDPADRVARPTQVSRKPPPTYLFRLTQPGARINDSVALVSLPSHCLRDELWSGVGVPHAAPFSRYSFGFLCVREGHGRPMFAVRAPAAISSPCLVYSVVQPA